MTSRRDFTQMAAASGLGAVVGSLGALRPPAPPSTDRLGWVNVFDHGARGDGKTDDTEAIQAAFDVRDSGVVYFPTSAYVVSRSIRVRGSMSIRGDAPRSTYLLSRIRDSSPLFEIGHSNYSKRLRGLRLADFTIRGEGPGRQGSGGIRLNAVYDSLIQNVRLDQLGWGIEGNRAMDTQFDNVVVRGMTRSGGASGEGVYFYGQSNSILFNKLRAQSNDGAAVRLGAGQQLTLQTPVFEDNRSTAIVIGRQQDGQYFNCRGVTIINPYFEKNRPYDMTFLRGTPPTLIQGFWGPNHDDYIAPVDYHLPFTAVSCDFPAAPGGAVRIDRSKARVLFLGCTFGGEAATFSRAEYRRSAALRLLDAEGDRTIGGR